MYSTELGMHIDEYNGNGTGWTQFHFSVFLIYQLSKGGCVDR